MAIAVSSACLSCVSSKLSQTAHTTTEFHLEKPSREQALWSPPPQWRLLAFSLPRQEHDGNLERPSFLTARRIPATCYNNQTSRYQHLSCSQCATPPCPSSSPWCSGDHSQAVAHACLSHNTCLHSSRKGLCKQRFGLLSSPKLK